MSLHIDDVRTGPANQGLAIDVPRPAMAARRGGYADARSTTTPPVEASPAGLRSRLQSVADEIDGLWRVALDSQDLDLVTRAVDASHGVHRALLALEDGRLVVGGRRGDHEASPLARVGHVAS